MPVGAAHNRIDVMAAAAAGVQNTVQHRPVPMCVGHQKCLPNLQHAVQRFSSPVTVNFCCRGADWWPGLLRCSGLYGPTRRLVGGEVGGWGWGRALAAFCPGWPPVRSHWPGRVRRSGSDSDGGFPRCGGGLRVPPVSGCGLVRAGLSSAVRARGRRRCLRTRRTSNSGDDPDKRTPLSRPVRGPRGGGRCGSAPVLAPSTGRWC